MPRSLHVKHSATLFGIDIASDFPHARSDSFLTRTFSATKESVHHLLGLLHPFDTNIYFARRTRYVAPMLRRVTRLNSAAKGTFGAELDVRAIF